MTLQSVGSASLGADSAAYTVHVSGARLQAQNTAQRLHILFGSAGVQITAGSTRVGLVLRAVGYGASLRAIGAARPRAKANRVTYAHAGLTEWYRNGPIGLEQGFMLPQAPAGHAAGPLTLSIALSGNARASLPKGGQVLTLSHAGGPSLRYMGLAVTDALGRPLRSWLEQADKRLLLRVDARGARYPVHVDPFVEQRQELAGTEESEASQFGYSVALSSDGNTALVGGPFADGERGALLVFTRSSGTWTEQAKLPDPSQTESAYFGYSVALSADGNTALVGDPLDNGEVGAAWVFTRSGPTWSQQGEKLTGNETGEEALFGFSVALSGDGNTAMIGGPHDGSVAGRWPYGAVWTFKRSGEAWSQVSEKLTFSRNPGEWAGFGSSVSLSEDGETALVGTEWLPWVFVYQWSEGGWHEEQQFRLTTLGAFLGRTTVSLSGDGNTALVADEFENHADVWAYSRPSTSVPFPERAALLTPTEDGAENHFGSSLALSSDGATALVGDERTLFDGGFRGPGEVWIFRRAGSGWAQEGSSLTGPVGGKGFGVSVALSGDESTALVGVPEDGSSPGAMVFANAPTLPNPPSVETNAAASFLGQTSATVSASVNPSGLPISECKFEYGTTVSYGSSQRCFPSPGSGESPVAVSAALTGLSTNTTYHFRIIATNAYGTTTGTDETFTTLVNSASGTTTEPTKPAVASDGQLSATASGGTGTVTVGEYASDPGGPPPFESSGEYSDLYQGPESSFTKIEFTDCGLSGASTLYWFNPQANGGNGEWEDVSRQTYIPGPPACIAVEIEASGTSPTLAEMTGTRFGDALADAPTVTTGSASSVTQTTATLDATVNPNGLEVTSCRIEYGTSLPSQTSVACSPAPGSRTAAVDVSGAVDDLTPNTACEYRVVATNAGGTSIGATEGFTTLPAGSPPAITKLSPAKGPATGGTLVTITGSYLTGAEDVKFGSNPGRIKSVSVTSITAESPAGTGTVNVAVTTPNGTSAISKKDHFKYKKAKK